MDNLMKTAAAITGTAAVGAGGTVTVATITSPAAGLLGVIGLTTTTTVALPLTAIVAVSGAVGYGIYKGVKYAQQSER